MLVEWEDNLQREQMNQTLVVIVIKNLRTNQENASDDKQKWDPPSVYPLDQSKEWYIQLVIWHLWAEKSRADNQASKSWIRRLCPCATHGLGEYKPHALATLNKMLCCFPHLVSTPTFSSFWCDQFIKYWLYLYLTTCVFLFVLRSLWISFFGACV